MIALVEADAAGSLANSGGTGSMTILQRYDAYVLIDTPELPEGIDPTRVEVLDDETIHVNGQAVVVPSGAFEAGDGPRYLVRFLGPMADAWSVHLAEKGIEVRFWCPRFGACLELPPTEGVDALRSFAFVAGAIPYRQEHCQRELDAPRPALRRSTAVAGHWLDIVCFSRKEREQVEAELARLGIPVLDVSSSKIRVAYDGDPAELRDLLGVKVVDAARGARLLAQPSPLAVALGMAAPDGSWAEGLDGKGEIIAIADTGLDTGAAADAGLHPDFRGRVKRLFSWPLNPSWDDVVEHPGSDDGPADRHSGHGTFVAGVALGSGAASGGARRGVAPEASLVFQAIEQFTAVKPGHGPELVAGFHLSGKPLDLRDLFERARKAGARIHVNAWGDPARGAYTNESFEADLYLREHPNEVVLYAAGNDGTDEDGNRVIDSGTLNAPATAKNVISVGATEGPTVGVGLLATWTRIESPARHYRNPADRADRVSGEPDRMALLSSAGPTSDGRIKPDICAPGTNLAAARSSLITGKAWGAADPFPLYMFNGGTSVSVGVVGGVIAVLRQQWRKPGRRSPSGAALKAILIAGAGPVLVRGGDRPEARTVAGFGRASVSTSLPGAVQLVVDGRKLRTGARHLRRIDVTQGGRLRAVLAWYDVPGERLVNDLDLVLEDSDGRRTFGNHPDGQPGTADRVNSVEVVDIDVDPGRYTVSAIGANVPDGPQPFAMAVTGTADFRVSGT